MAKWWDQGIQFECQGSGKCCLSRGSVGSVYVTLEDRENLADLMGLAITKFTNDFCEKQNGFFRLKEEATRSECMFLRDKKCSVYESRPTQCRTWPFWPELMNAKTWAAEVADFCPGVGKGPIRSNVEIESILKTQRLSDRHLNEEAQNL